MNESRFTAPEPRRASRAVVAFAAAVVVIFALVIGRFAVMSTNSSLGAVTNGSNLSQAAAFPTATPISGSSNQAASGTVVAGAPQALVKIIAGFPRPDVDTQQQ
jgi:hypothetical protein